MKTVMLKVIILSFIGINFVLAASYEYPAIYKDTRIMGMGGANVAVGGEASSIFYNPAGLMQMEESEGIEIDLFNLTFAFSGNFFDFLKVLQDNQTLIDTDLSAFITAMNPYRSSNYHLAFNDYSSVSYRGSDYAWSVGYLVGADLNAIPHLSLGADGLIEMHLKTTSALIGGFAYEFNDELMLGLGLKTFSGFNKASTINVISASSIPSTLDELNDYSTSAVDLGLTYIADDLWPFDSFADLEPTLGLSVLNIGGLDMGDFYASIPSTVNIGISIRPELPFFEDWVFAFDYIDLFNTYSSSAGLDSDPSKHIRVGTRASVFNNSFVEFTGSLGSYNSAVTYGVEARLAIFNIFFSSYVEEIGAYSGQNADRRYQLSLAVGW